MNAIISKFGLGLVTAMTLLTSCAIGVKCWGAWSNCCNWLELNGCWEAGAAVLYQQHCVQNFTFATDQAPTRGNFGGKAYDVRPKFYWGFQIWGAWYHCDGCSFANLTWKHLWSNKDQRRITGGPFSLTNVSSAGLVIVVGRQRLQYDTVYLRAGRNLFCACNSRFYVYGGLRYAGAEIRRQVEGLTAAESGGPPDPSVMSNRTYFQGGGVEVGVGGEYGLGCGFNLVGTFGAMALVGQRNETYTSSSTSILQFLFFKDHNITKCVPGIDFRFALNYTYDWCACGCNLRLVAEVGWEMDYYWNMLVLRDALVSVFNFNKLSSVNFGTNGPYGSLAVRF